MSNPNTESMARMNQTTVVRDAVSAAAWSAPPWLVWAMNLNNIFLLVSVGYVLAQWAYLVWKWRREARRAP